MQSFAPANMITGPFISEPADRGLMRSAKRFVHVCVFETLRSSCKCLHFTSLVHLYCIVIFAFLFDCRMVPLSLALKLSLLIEKAVSSLTCIQAKPDKQESL